MKTRTVTSLALGLALSLPAVAAADDLVVIEAKGLDLQPGQVIDSAAPVTLPEGANLVLITADGSQVTLTGPFQGVPVSGEGGGSNSVVTSLAGLIAGRDADTSSLGAVRDAGAPAELPAPWLVDATVGGSGCFKAADGVVLWRPSAEADAEIAFMPADRAWTAGTVWPAGEASLGLGTEAPFEDGATFLFELGGVASAVTLHIMPETLVNDRMVAGWMKAKGCERQAKALAKTLQ